MRWFILTGSMRAGDSSATDDWATERASKRPDWPAAVGVILVELPCNTEKDSTNRFILQPLPQMKFQEGKACKKP